MNLVVLTGRICKDIDMKVNGESCVARFSVACDRRFKRDGDETADFISCVAFSKTAEFINKYFSKGQKINIQGEWRTGSYTNKDGVKVYTNDCIVNNVEFGESKAKQNTQETSNDGFMSIPDGTDEELPFS